MIGRAGALQALLLGALLFGAVLLAPGDAAAQPSQIKHVVIVIQENRSTDNLFGGFQAELPRADLASAGLNSKGEMVELTPTPLGGGFDLDHSHAGFLEAYDNGRMDGADLMFCGPPPTGTCPPNAAFRYVNPGDVLPYYEIAKNYSFANRMFQTNQGPSFAAHLFLLAGTSQLTATSPLFASENMVYSKTNYGDPGTGCPSLPWQRAEAIAPDGSEGQAVFPCFEHRTLTDLLDQHKPAISWRYYAPTTPGDVIWNAPNAIRHICQPGGKPLACQGPAYKNGSVVLYPARVLRDIPAGNLAGVTWIIPSGQDSDHPGIAQQGTGPSWVAAIVNAIGRSKYWNDTAILITWDDWGGWYDHVRPPVDPRDPYNYYELGFRVPLLVVSRWTPAGYVSDRQHDFGSLLRFVETVYGLGRIPPGTFADARADDLLDFFDFNAAPRAFVPIAAPRDAAYFLDTQRPQLAPDDD